MSMLKTGRTLIIAEIGVNHEGDAGVAADLIRQAAAAGADAVKFQTFRAEHYVSSAQPERRARAARFELSSSEFEMLAAVARDHRVAFFSTPLHPDDVAPLLRLDVPWIKVSSGDLTYTDLLARVAASGKPIILSTGLGTGPEIAAAIETIRRVRPGIVASEDLMLMHCVSAYPTPDAEANLANISWLRDRFDLPVGYSDHTLGIEACMLSVAAGARAIEKHFTDRKDNRAFHDHALSADPSDFRDLVRSVRRTETFLGTYERVRGPSESKLLAVMRRSVGTVVDIAAGEPLQKAWLTGLRPAWGIPIGQIDMLEGRRLLRDLAAGDLVREEDLAPSE